MELQNILCPVDFSEDSVQALKYAAVLSLKYESVVHIFHSIHIPTSVPDAIGFGLPVETSSDMLYNNEGKSKEQVEELLRNVFKDEFEHVAYDVIIRYGFAADAIAEVAEETKSDLIVMYTSGADNFMGYMAGTVAAKVLNNVSCPVLVLPHAYTFNGIVKEIVFSTDLISEADDSVESVVSIARKFEAHISFLSIEKHPIAQSRNVVPFALNELLSKTSYKNISFHINENEHVIDGLQSFVREKNADLLVMTMRSRNFIKKFLEKSKTTEMLFHTKIPVLAFHK